MKPPRATTTPPAFVSPAPALATEYAIYVAAPERVPSGGTWPAVVVLDGDYFFDAAVSAARSLQANGVISPVGVIGIGYRKPFGDPGNRRGRDYTPTASPEEPASGGAAAFLAHLNNQLWPELLRRYPIERECSALAGHSLSALFVLYATFQPLPLYRRAIAGAPSIWWDNRSLLAHVARLRDQQAALSAEIYIGVGADETPSMLGDLALFDQQLAARPFTDLHVTTRLVPDRDHYNLVPDLFTGGLRAMFGRTE